MRGLAEHHHVEGLDCARRLGSGVRRANMAKPRSLDRLFGDADAVIDLAAHASNTTPWRDVWKNNLPATLNALEAARLAGARRFIFASSSRVTGLYEGEPPYSKVVAGELDGLDQATIARISPSWPIRPDGPYALGKVLGEAAARYYSDAFGVSAICLRLGSVNADDRPLTPRHFSTLLTHADLVRLFEAALTAPDDLRFGIYYGVSRNTWRIWDIEPACREIAYTPEDDAETFRRSAGRHGGER
jgi:nucleoside-diphosphate-sugar epimerase